MKKVENKKVVSTSFRSTPCLHVMPDVPHVSRGKILSGVLSGLAGYDSVPVMTDTPVSASEPDIDYNPETDQRLDRFDAVEMGIEAIDEKVSTPLPGGGAEKKE